MKKITSYLIIIFVWATICFINQPTKNENFKNSDATYHQLLTIKAFNQVPIKEHKFLPIVSLGKEQDKNINWGATVKDQNGNFYYTSFSSLGFFAPYLFFKMFNLSETVKNLYLFSNIIFLITSLLTALIFSKVLKKYSYFLDETKLILLSSIIYFCQLELMHSQGIVYWHHSLFQMFFIIQLYLFLEFEKELFNTYKINLFYMLVIIMPYLEWTGYLSNVGFALSIIFLKNLDFKQKIKKILTIAILTLISGLLFYFHFLLNIDSVTLNNALISRFFARNFQTKVSYMYLIIGYIESYKWILSFIITGLIVVILKKECRKNLRLIFRETKMITFILIFPILENLIMKEHAITYSFDRLKGSYILIFILLSLFICLENIVKNKKKYYLFVAGIVLLMGILNLKNYKQDNIYRWKINYLERNLKFANYINNNFPKNKRIIGQSLAVRGYSNILFESGIYEGQNINSLSVKKTKETKYIVYLEADLKPWNVYEYKNAKIVDLELGNIINLDINLNKTNILFKNIQATDLTDQNWENGINRINPIILFNYSIETLLMLNQNKLVKTNQFTKKINKIDYDNLWIRVYLEDNKNISEFKYPNQLEIAGE